MAIQTTGVRYVTQGVDEFVKNVQKAQANLDAMTKNMQASASAIRGASADLNTHTRSLNSMIRSNNALSQAQRIANGTTQAISRSITSANTPLSIMSRVSAAATTAFRGFATVGRGIGTVFGSIVSGGRTAGNAIVNLGKGFAGLLSSARNSLSTLTGFGRISETLGNDIGYLLRRVLLLSSAFAALSSLEGFIKLGLQQVQLYDRLTHSVAALTANELLAAGSVDNFREGLKQAIPFTKQMLDWVERLAIVSIFESGDIQSVQQFGQSVGMSAKDAAAMTFALTAWGTVTDKQPHTLMLIANALTDMFSKGRVQAEEMKQLARNGIPAWDMLAKSLGVTVEELRQMVTDGLVPADEGIRALVSGMANLYGPALQDFAFSISGITSSLKDIAKINSRELFRGIVDAAMPFMERVVAVLTQPETKAAFQEMGRSLGETATQAFTFVEALIASGDPIAFVAVKINESLPGFYKLYEQLTKLGQTFAEIATKAFGWGEGIGKGIADGIISAASLVLSAMQRIADIINNFLSGKMTSDDALGGALGGDLSDQTGGQQGGDTAPSPTPSPGGGASGAPPELPGGMGSQLNLGDDMFAPLTDSLDRLNEKADEAKSHWNDLRNSFQEARAAIVETHPAVEKLTPLVAGLGGAFGVILTSGLASAALGLLRLLSPIGLITAAGAGLYSAWESNFLGIRDIVANATPVIQEKVQAIADYLSGPFINDVKGAASRFQEEWEKNSAKVDAAAESINRAIEKDIMPVVKEVSDFIEKKLGPVMSEVATAAVPLLQSALRLLASILEGIVIPQVRVAWEVFSTLLWPIIEVGADILTGVLFPAISTVFDFISGNIIPIFKAWYDFISGSIIPIIERVTTIIILLIQIGIAPLIAKWNESIESIKLVWQWMGTLIDKVPGLRQSIDGLIGSIGFVIGKLTDWEAGFNSIIGVIQNVIGWLDGIIAKLKEIADTPSPILGNSPSPMEISLKGIGATLVQVTRLFANFTRGMINTGRASKDLAEDFQDIADDTRDFIDDLEELSLSSMIGGFETMRDNMDFVADFRKEAMEDLDHLTEFQKYQVKLVVDSLEPQLEEARKRYMATVEQDPESAIDRFNMESRHISELSSLEAQIIKAKDEKERNRLLKQREYLYAQQALEIKLFEQQAQRRAEAVEKEAKALVDAFSKAWAQMIKDNVIPTPDLTQLFQLIQALSQLKLPDWLTPGSPTPLENAVRGISSAIKHLAGSELPTLRFQMQQIGTPAMFGQIMNKSQSYTYAPNYNLGVTTNQSPQYALQSFEMMRAMYGG